LHSGAAGQVIYNREEYNSFCVKTTVAKVLLIENEEQIAAWA
jgi:hypothetical protein